MPPQGGKMAFGFFKRKDPVCGMKEEAGKGINDKETGKWFCSSSCKDNYRKALKDGQKKGGGCCGH